jgi:RNA polymerase sigma-70 factor (ECF subfamily)
MTPDQGATPSLKNTDTEWFDTLYLEHKSSVYRFACYLTQNRNEADDLFQETWLRVVRYLPDSSPVKNHRAWIFTIAANLYKDMLRKKKTQRMIFVSRSPHSDGNSEKEFEGSVKPGGPDESDRVDLGMAIDQALRVLPYPQRRVFVLKELEGFKLSEISSMLKVPVGTVKSLMFRAVKRLQKELSPFSDSSVQNAESLK